MISRERAALLRRWSRSCWGITGAFVLAMALLPGCEPQEDRTPNGPAMVNGMLAEPPNIPFVPASVDTTSPFRGSGVVVREQGGYGFLGGVRVDRDFVVLTLAMSNEDRGTSATDVVRGDGLMGEFEDEFVEFARDEALGLALLRPVGVVPKPVNCLLPAMWGRDYDATSTGPLALATELLIVGETAVPSGRGGDAEPWRYAGRMPSVVFPAHVNMILGEEGDYFAVLLPRDDSLLGARAYLGPGSSGDSILLAGLLVGWERTGDADYAVFLNLGCPKVIAFLDRHIPDRRLR